MSASNIAGNDKCGAERNLTGRQWAENVSSDAAGRARGQRQAFITYTKLAVKLNAKKARQRKENGIRI